MRTLLFALAVTAPIALSVATPGTARDRNQVPEATPAGKSESCIPLVRIRQSHVRSDQVIDFEMNGGKVYRNTLPQSCPGLGFQESFSYKTSLSQLCSSDIITVLQSPPSIPGPSCGLGQFQPVTLAKKAKR
ncbi:hypothetical protein [Sphingomonas sp. ERG5]|uniref:hypothetical protein n=1 Tax=Sphingomonas sp. ERG5 TaxID=1381597 RepID=UPI00054B85A7|nr:hypothetical protein [Sphingomonas sp. ERG5]